MAINTTGFKTEVKRGSLAATNIRILLKNTFPNTKFSVIQRQSYAIDVSWTDAPAHDAVKELLSPFDIGVSDSYSDYWSTKSTEFSKKFGGVQYLELSHTVSQEVIELVINKIAAKYPTLENRHYKQVAVTVDAYTNGWELRDSYIFEDLFEDYLSAHYENRLSKNELERIASDYRDGIKDLPETDFIEAISELDDTERLLNEVCYYLDWDCGDCYAKISIAQATGKEIDTTEILYKIGEAKKALRGIPTDSELRTIEAQQQHEAWILERDKVLAIDFIAVDFEQGKRKKVSVSLPSLNKNNSIHENDEEIAKDGYQSNYEVCRTVTVNNETWALVTNNFLSDCKAWDGAYCGTVVYDEMLLDGVKEYTDEWYAIYREHGTNTCIELVNGETGEKLYVDTQGYSYARYVGREYIEPFTPAKLEQDTYKHIAGEFYTMEVQKIISGDMLTGNDEFESQEEWMLSAKERFFDSTNKIPVPTRHAVETITNDILSKLMSI